MTIHYEIVESSTGDSLGAVELGEEMPDEHIIEMLVSGGYLDPPTEDYEIDDAYPFSETGERTIIDIEGEPVLTLDPGYEDDDDIDDEDSDDDGLNSEDVL